MVKRKCKTLKLKPEFALPTFLTKQNDYEYENVCSTGNGLYFGNIYIPEEIVLLILSFINPEEILNATLVCRLWNKLIKSNQMWCMIYKRKRNRKAKILPWYFYYCILSSKYFDNNLLLNGNGQNGLNHWEYKWEGEEYIEKAPIGASALPTNVIDFNDQTSCFATSYFSGYKKQTVMFGKSGLFRYILNNYKPHIYLSEWTTGRLDCGGEYILQCGFVQGNQFPKISNGNKPSATCFKAEWETPKWRKVELVITEYPEGVEGITFENTGNNMKVWKGHFGIKMAGGVVKLLSETIEPLPIDEHGNIEPKHFSNVSFFTNKQLGSTSNLAELDVDLWNGEYDDEIYYYMPS